MNQIWILAWVCGLSQVHLASQARVRTTFSEERSLKKRQLDFEGGGGGVNRYVNGDQDYEDIYSIDYRPQDDVEYWRMVSPTGFNGLSRLSLQNYFLFHLHYSKKSVIVKRVLV